jgi:hypothetical protein
VKDHDGVGVAAAVVATDVADLERGIGDQGAGPQDEGGEHEPEIDKTGPQGDPSARCRPGSRITG